MKTKLLGLLLSYALLVCSAFLHAQNPSALTTLKKGVVKITAYDSRGREMKGAGIVIGQGIDSLYILTAFHVVNGANRIEALFFQADSNTSPSQPIKTYGPFLGRTIKMDSRDLDVGVLSVQCKPTNPLRKRIPRLMKGNSYQLKPQALVTCVGHPLNKAWQTPKEEVLALSHNADFRKLEITKIAVHMGNSGGPLFDDRLRLIGMMIGMDANSAIAVKIDPVLHLLKSWGIPTNFVQDPPCGGLDTPRISIPPTNRKISYLTTSLGILTTGTFAWYLTEKNNANDEFAKYRDAMNTEEAVSRRIQTEKAVSRRNIACYATIGAGSVFAALLVRDLIRSKPRKFAEQSYPPKEATKKLGLRLDSNPHAHALSVNININF